MHLNTPSCRPEGRQKSFTPPKATDGPRFALAQETLNSFQNKKATWLSDPILEHIKLPSCLKIWHLEAHFKAPLRHLFISLQKTILYLLCLPTNKKKTTTQKSVLKSLRYTTAPLPATPSQAQQVQQALHKPAPHWHP